MLADWAFRRAYPAFAGNGKAEYAVPATAGKTQLDASRNASGRKRLSGGVSQTQADAEDRRRPSDLRYSATGLMEGAPKPMQLKLPCGESLAFHSFQPFVLYRL
jgi:hypothetical protein